MKRREFIAAAGALTFLPRSSLAQGKAPKYADMHAHLGFKLALGLRAQMEKGGMLLAAEKITPDALLIQRLRDKLGITRQAKPGEMRRNYEAMLERFKARMRQEDLPEIASVAALDRALAERRPGIVLSAEGGDFIEGDLAYLDKVRADGLVHMQIAHFYGWSDIADIATEQPRHQGLTAFGRRDRCRARRHRQRPARAAAHRHAFLCGIRRIGGRIAPARDERSRS